MLQNSFETKIRSTHWVARNQNSVHALGGSLPRPRSLHRRQRPRIPRLAFPSVPAPSLFQIQAPSLPLPPPTAAHGQPPPPSQQQEPPHGSLERTAPRQVQEATLGSLPPPRPLGSLQRTPGQDTAKKPLLRCEQASVRLSAARHHLIPVTAQPVSSDTPNQRHPRITTTDCQQLPPRQASAPATVTNINAHVHTTQTNTSSNNSLPQAAISTNHKRPKTLTQSKYPHAATIKYTLLSNHAKEI